MWSQLKSIANITAVSIALSVSTMHEIGSLAKVEGTSMQPTFNPDNGVAVDTILSESNELPKKTKILQLKLRLRQDRILLNKWSIKNKNNLRVGDIVVFISPQDPNKRMIKRIMAMPGDVIQIFETGDIVYIGPGHCWLEGDNQLSSYDSANFGPVPLGLVEGRAALIWWPVDRMQRIINDSSKSYLSTRTKLLT